MGAVAGTQVGQAAEWSPARLALVCEPAIETLFPSTGTDTAGFARPLSLPLAVSEHRALRRRLESVGTRVLDVREVLAHGDIEVLRDAAQRAFPLVVEGSSPGADHTEVERRHGEHVRSLDPETLASVVILRPTEHLRFDLKDEQRPTFTVEPVSDVCFVRTRLLVTKAGVVVGRTSFENQRAEGDLTDLILRQLGLQPIARVFAPGLAEGGDLLVAGNFALMGQGSASNEDGIGQLLDAGAFGDVEVGVVRDPRGPAAPGRLEDHLTLFGPALAGICEDRLGPVQPEVDVYTPQPTMAGRRYRRKRVAGLLEYLRSKSFRILTFTVAEREAFASAGVTLGPMRYLAPASAGDAFVSRLRDHGVSVELLPFSELGSASCGPRRAIQILHRVSERASR